MNMEACPKYQTCSATICPLDPSWRKRRHLKGERICFYLCEAQSVTQKRYLGVEAGENCTD